MFSLVGAVLTDWPWSCAARLANAGANSGLRIAVKSCLDCAREGGRDGGCQLLNDVRVDPQGDTRVCVAEACGHHMDGHAGEQQRRRVNVPQVVRAP